MFLRTERLFLRPPFPEDWREVYHGINDESVVRMLARAPWPYQEQDAQAYCNTKRDPWDVRMAIALPGVFGAPIIGQIGVDCSGDCSGDEPEVGYWIAREHQRRGYASEALRGILQIARALGVKRLVAGHYLDNPASGAVLRKCGFEETGEVQATRALGRGGQMVLARRYALDLDREEGPDDGPNDAEDDVMTEDDMKGRKAA